MTEAPPIVKLTERVLVEIELAVRGFARYHKYSSGADLRRDARAVAIAAIRAWRDHERRGERLEDLAAAVDVLKLTLQLAQRVEAFKSFAQFEALARTISNLGRQYDGSRQGDVLDEHPSRDSNRGTTMKLERLNVFATAEEIAHIKERQSDPSTDNPPAAHTAALAHGLPELPDGRYGIELSTGEFVKVG